MIYSISITWYNYPRTMNKGTTKSALYVNQVDLRITHYLPLFPLICQCWFLHLVFAGSCKVCLPTEDRQQEAVSLSHRLVLLPLLISNKTELGSLAYRTPWLWIRDDYRIDDILDKSKSFDTISFEHKLSSDNQEYDIWCMW